MATPGKPVTQDQPGNPSEISIVPESARKPNETWKQKDIFETYLMMGPSRSIAQLAKATNVRTQTLVIWNRKFDWPSRLEARDQKAIARLQADNDEKYFKDIKLRHQKLYQEIQEKAIRQIRKDALNFDSDKDAAFALDIGIKGERAVLGMNQTSLKAGMVKEGFAAFVEAVVND